MCTLLTPLLTHHSATAGDAVSSRISSSCDSEPGGMSPLMGAAGQGHVSIIRLLYKAGESLFPNNYQMQYCFTHQFTGVS
jgi:hypothetical protein